MTKKVRSMLAVYAIIFVIYNVIFWVIPFPKTAAAVISYVFSLIAIAAAAGATYFAFSKGDDLRSKVYGFPIFHIAAAYAGVQTVFGFIIAIIGCFAEIPAWIAVVVSIILLGIAAIGVISADNERDVITAQETETELKTKAVKYFKVDIEGIADICSDDELKKKVSALAEELRYSDPVSSPELEETENKISDEINLLREVVSSDKNAALEKVTKISSLLADRNRRCKAFKK